MALSEEAFRALLNARTAYIEDPAYSIVDWHVAIDAHTAEDSPERATWLAHIDPLTEAMNHNTALPSVRDRD